MTPHFTIDDLADITCSNAEFQSKNTLQFSGSITFADTYDIQLSEPGVPDLLAAYRPAASVHVVNILLPRTVIQMQRITAGRIIAVMAPFLSWRTGESCRQLDGERVCGNLAALT